MPTYTDAPYILHASVVCRECASELNPDSQRTTNRPFGQGQYERTCDMPWGCGAVTAYDVYPWKTKGAR
jgi:hypothetical protein